MSFKSRMKTPAFVAEIGDYFRFLRYYTRSRGYSLFARFEKVKDVLVDFLYRKRGRYSRPFLHFGTIGLVFLMVTLGPLFLNRPDDDQEGQSAQVIQTASAYFPDFYTLQAEEVRQYRGGEIITHIVSDGETLSGIADRYGVEVSTILWENDLSDKSKIKPSQELKILPLNGVRHKVTRGETIYTIGKKYGLEESQTQMMVDYPFNEFLNDETFELVIGQNLMVPDGVKKTAKVAYRPTSNIVVNFTPDAGAVSGNGSFIWPAGGGISQGYRFYHKAYDISNRAGGPILASDSGIVTVAGWVDGYGYGNRVMLDHGNGYQTLYAHLSVIQVKVGQRVNRGDVLGQMGNTGRSTGTHLHFEIRQGGTLLNPASFLR